MTRCSQLSPISVGTSTECPRLLQRTGPYPLGTSLKDKLNLLSGDGEPCALALSRQLGPRVKADSRGSAARSEILTMLSNRALRVVPVRWGLRRVRPVRSAAGDLAAEFTAALDVEGMADRLRCHPQLRPFRMVAVQGPADLLRAPPLVQPVLHQPVQLRGSAPCSRWGSTSSSRRRRRPLDTREIAVLEGDRLPGVDGPPMVLAELGVLGVGKGLPDQPSDELGLGVAKNRLCGGVEVGYVPAPAARDEPVAIVSRSWHRRPQDRCSATRKPARGARTSSVPTAAAPSTTGPNGPAAPTTRTGPRQAKTAGQALIRMCPRGDLNPHALLGH